MTDLVRSAGAGLTVRAMEPSDAAAVLAIYQQGLDSGHASFETAVPTWEVFSAGKLPGHRIVAVDARNRVLGWIACSRVSARPVYEGVVEHSVYVHPEARNRGVGQRLLDAFIASTEAAGIWTIQSGIFPENTASLALHERAGFQTLGVRARLGRHEGIGGGRWRDVVFIERRSRLVG